MANKSKAKGTRAESAVVKYLNDHGIRAERRALSGSEDKGDIKVEDSHGNQWIIEVKAGKQTHNPSRTQVEEWIRQAKEEGRNSGFPSVLCIVRYNRKLKDAEIYLQQGNCRRHMYLDEFAEYLNW